MDKKQKLARLKEKMEQDMSLPLRVGATNLVFGEGNPDARVYFIGEGPGYYEDQQARPFVGQAGKLLDKLLESISLKREDVYISNIVRFRPPENRDPTDQEIEAFRPYVDEEIKIISPDIIVSLGRFSMNKFLPGTKISQTHGQSKIVDLNGKKMTVLPMYHPAAALRAGAIMEQLQKDFQEIKKTLVELDDNQVIDFEEEAVKEEQLKLI